MAVVKVVTAALAVQEVMTYIRLWIPLWALTDRKVSLCFRNVCTRERFVVQVDFLPTQKGVHVQDERKLAATFSIGASQASASGTNAERPLCRFVLCYFQRHFLVQFVCALVC
jgi:hypothetical protein